MASNNFALSEQPLEAQNSQMAMVLAAQVSAEIQAACVMAKNSPRDWDVVREKILAECKRTSFAAVARYRKPIGAGVEGFSIRFAEAAIQAAKHIHVTVRTIWEDQEQRKVLVKVWDAQEMISYSDEVTIEKTIERRSIPQGAEVIRTRKNKAGDLLYILAATEDDLLNKVNAGKSKSIRTNGLRLIPGWIQDQALAAIRATIKAADAADPDAAKQKLFDAFGELGVDVEQLKTFIGHDARALTPRELQELRSLYASVHDGETTMFAVLEEIKKERAAPAAKDEPSTSTAKPAAATGATQSVKDKLLERGRKAAAAAGPAPAMSQAVEGTVLPKTPEETRKVVADLAAKATNQPTGAARPVAQRSFDDETPPTSSGSADATKSDSSSDPNKW